MTRHSSQNGALNFRIVGAQESPMRDLYHYMLSISWSRLLGLAALGYIAGNLVFALLFLLGGDCVENAEPGSFLDAFWFSVQTLSTIGYGGMAPKTIYAHILVTIESFIGLLSVAMGTGLIFAKFARPMAKISFSNCMVVCPRNGVPCLMFRMANDRGNQIVEAKLNVSVLLQEVSSEGHHMRRFHKLKLERSESPVFALSWLVIHPLDEESPLFGLSPENVNDTMSIVISLTGIDETFAQEIYGRYHYAPSSIQFDAKFVDIIGFDPDGTVVLHREKLDQTEPMEAAQSVVRGEFIEEI